MNPFISDGQGISIRPGDKPSDPIEYDFIDRQTFQGASVDGETLLDPSFDSLDNLDAFLPALLDTSFPVGDQGLQNGNIESLRYQQSQDPRNLQIPMSYDESLLQNLAGRKSTNTPPGNQFSPNTSSVSFPSPVSAPVNFTRTDIDMNDPIKLELYSQILLFRDDASRENLVFNNPDYEKQEVLSKIAHGLGLECEYRLRQRQTVISRLLPEDPIDLSGLNESNQAKCFPLVDNAARLNNVDIHSQVKSYICKCGKSFAGYDILAQHRGRGLCIGASDHSKRAANKPRGSDLDVLDNLSFDDSINLVSHYHSIAETIFTDHLADPQVNRTSIENPYHPMHLEAESIRSRVTSINSTKNTRGRERTKALTSRASSPDESPSFQEIIFDSKLGNNLRQPLTSRGRRGPLNKIKRTGIETLRAMGACWRCKILRKQCDPYNPCKACPESLKDKKMPKKSEWQIIGCRRGAIQTELSPILLCPQAVLKHTVLSSVLQTSTRNNLTTTPCEHANTYLRESNDQRRKNINESLSPLVNHQVHLALLEINWEFGKHPGVRSMLLNEIVDFPALLEYAADYQAIFDSSCVEALKLRELGYLSKSTHDACKPPNCLVDCILHLESQISSYIDDLSQVIFKKENRKDPKKWWLSTFYSLCVQSFVRMGLIILVDDSTSDKESAQIFNTNQYLWLAVRLFGVGSATYDPLVASLSSKAVSDSSEDKKFESCHELAKASVKSKLWEQHGIISSRECLKKLFDDDGTPIAEIAKHNSSMPDLSDLYSSNSSISIPNPQVCLPPPLPPPQYLSCDSARPDITRQWGNNSEMDALGSSVNPRPSLYGRYMPYISDDRQSDPNAADLAAVLKPNSSISGIVRRSVSNLVSRNNQGKKSRRPIDKEQWQSPYVSESDVSSIQSYGRRESFGQDSPSYEYGFPLEEETSDLRRLHIENSSQGSLTGSKRRASSPLGNNMDNISDLFQRRETSRPSPVAPGFYSQSKRRGSYASGHSLNGSVTSLSSYGRRSPGSEAEDAFPPSHASPRRPRSTTLFENPALTTTSSLPFFRNKISNIYTPPLKVPELNDTRDIHICECCPKKPKKFNTEEELV
ncbi:hypothetical protein B7494_g6354 [Chlorociboria aeruginascens]|nr:hypothetical protein B7494_g6354 [Chlorociboria aeruginascens]